jgi:hypothetical protein
MSFHAELNATGAIATRGHNVNPYTKGGLLAITDTAIPYYSSNPFNRLTRSKEVTPAHILNSSIARSLLEIQPTPEPPHAMYSTHNTNDESVVGQNKWQGTGGTTYMSPLYVVRRGEDVHPY